MSGKYNDSYNEIANKWSLEDLQKGLEWIELYEKIEEKQAKEMEAKSKGR